MIFSQVSSQVDIFPLVFELNIFIYKKINGCFLALFPSKSIVKILLKIHHYILDRKEG